MRVLWWWGAVAACGAEPSAPVEVVRPMENRFSELTEPTGGSPLVGEPIVAGALSARHVMDRVNGREAAIIGCYAEHAQERTGGKVVVKFGVLPDGSTESMRVTSSVLRAPAVEDCVVGVLEAVVFDAPEDGRPARVAVPLTFSP